MSDTLDCGDSSCLFAEQRTGMRTNGGCHCLDGLPIREQRAARMYFQRLRAERDSLRADAQTAVRTIAALTEERDAARAGMKRLCVEREAALADGDALRAQLAEAQDRMWRLEDQVTMQQIARAYEDSDGLRAQLAERWWGEFVAVWAAIGWHFRWWDTYQSCPDCRKYEDEIAEVRSRCSDLEESLQAEAKSHIGIVKTLAERDATIAGMRRALEEARRDRDLNMYAVDMIEGALSPDAGKRLAERIAAMDDVVVYTREAKVALDRALDAALDRSQLRTEMREIRARLSSALAAIDAKEGK